MTRPTFSKHAGVEARAGAPAVPIMFLRIDAPRAHAHQLLQLLKERSVEAQQIEHPRDRVVMRAELPLSKLVGLERLAAEATDGAAHTMCWLLRYGAAPPHG